MIVYILTATLVIITLLYARLLWQTKKVIGYNEQLFKTCIDLHQENKELRQQRKDIQMGYINNMSEFLKNTRKN